jgi:hypothetical protein
VQEPAETAVVVQVNLGDQGSLGVTQSAKTAMDTALSYLSKNPPPFFGCKQVVWSVILILGKELLSYTRPQSVDDLKAFDWNTVVIGDPKTYPQAPPPPKEDFDQVRAVYTLAKVHWDKEAKKIGMNKSGVPTYTSFLQKWKLWRDYHAIYRTMYPMDTLGTSHDRFTISCKSRTSAAAMLEAVEQDMQAFLGERARAELADRLALELAVREAAERDAKEKATQLLAEKAQAALEVLAPTTQGGRVTRRVAEANREQQKAAAADVDDRIQEATLEVLNQRLEAEKIRRERQKLIAKDAKEKSRKKKQAKRHQTELLDSNPTPRKKATTDNGWEPPKLIRRGGIYSPPGAHWKNASIKKLQLLCSLRNQLTVADMLQKPMTLALVMEWLSADGDDTTFQERVFLYLMFLLMSEAKYVHGGGPCCSTLTMYVI